MKVEHRRKALAALVERRRLAMGLSKDAAAEAGGMSAVSLCAQRLLEPGFRDQLVTNSDGQRPIVVVLPDDTAEYLFRTAQAGGDAANIVTFTQGHIFQFAMRFASNPAAPKTNPEDDCPIHRNTQVDMLVTYLLRQSGPVRCELLGPEAEITPAHALEDVTV